MDLSQIFYILYKQIEKMHNFTSWASIKLCCALVCLNQVSYQLLMWDVRSINLKMFSPLGTVGSE